MQLSQGIRMLAPAAERGTSLMRKEEFNDTPL